MVFWPKKVANLINYFYFCREQKRRKLDREILHLEFAAQGLEGTLADKRRAAARFRNNQLMQVRIFFTYYDFSDCHFCTKCFYFTFFGGTISNMNYM